MTQQGEGAASKTSYCRLHSGGTMSKGGGRYCQVSWHPGNGIQAWKPQRARGAGSLLGSDAAVGVEGDPSLLLGLHHSPSFVVTKVHQPISEQLQPFLFSYAFALPALGICPSPSFDFFINVTRANVGIPCDLLATLSHIQRSTIQPAEERACQSSCTSLRERRKDEDPFHFSLIVLYFKSPLELFTLQLFPPTPHKHPYVQST